MTKKKVGKKLKKEDMNLKVALQPADDPKTPEQGEVAEENGDGEMGADKMDMILSAMQDLQASIANISQRVDAMESDEVEEEVEEMTDEDKPMDINGDSETMDEEEITEEGATANPMKNKPTESADEDEDDVVEEDLKGIPERPQGDKKEKPMGAVDGTAKNPNPIPAGQKQTSTGNAPGDDKNDIDKTKTGDDMGAPGKVPKPSSDYPKDKVTQNKLEDPITKELNKLKSQMEALEKNSHNNPMADELQKFEDYTNLTQKQSVSGATRTAEAINRVGMSAVEAAELDANKEAVLEARQTSTSVVQEYLNKPGVLSRALRRNFGLPPQ